MSEKFKPLRTQMGKKYFKEEEYEESLKLSKEFYKAILKDSERDSYDFWYYFMMMSRIFNQDKFKYHNRKKALEYVLESKKHLIRIQEGDIETYQYSTMWQEGMCWKGINDALAYDILLECYYHFNKVKDFERASYLAHELGLIKQDIDMIMLAIDQTEEIINNSENIDKTSYENAIDDMYIDIFRIHKNNNNNELATQILSNIKNQHKRKELTTQVFQLFA